MKDQGRSGQGQGTYEGTPSSVSHRSPSSAQIHINHLPPQQASSENVFFFNQGQQHYLCRAKYPLHTACKQTTLLLLALYDCFVRCPRQAAWMLVAASYRRLAYSRQQLWMRWAANCICRNLRLSTKPRQWVWRTMAALPRTRGSRVGSPCFRLW